MSKIIKNMIGNMLLNIFYKKYLNIGFEEVIFELQKHAFFSLKAEVNKSDGIESLSLKINNVSKIPDDYDILEVNLTINDAILYRRDEWVMTGNSNNKLICNIQHEHVYGPVGSAPQEADAVITVNAGLVLNLGERRQRVLCYISSFPLLVEYSVDEHEIVKFLNNCSIS